jgi:serine/threonine protein phosphatase PrpC
LTVSIGHYSSRGRKASNQDFHGALIPEPPLLGMKGLVAAVADGISTSAVSAIAAETAVKSLLTDYFSTPDSWPVRTAAQRVIAATNSWLFAQGQGGSHPDDPDRGYVCTLSALILKSRSAHILHIGDSRISRLAGPSIEPLTEDHRSGGRKGDALLARALGIRRHVEIDYLRKPLAVGDIFVLTTDGIHGFVDGLTMAQIITRSSTNLDQAASDIAALAVEHGSDDNLTIQILRVDALPSGGLAEHLETPPDVPLLRPLREHDVIDGLRVVRQLHGNARSCVYLVEEPTTGRQLVLKAPVMDEGGDTTALRQFLLENWVAAQVDSPHLLKPVQRPVPLTALYHLTDYVAGETLTEWLRRHPHPSLGEVRTIVDQIGKGLTALHRRSVIHQDLRPDNILVSREGRVTIIDYGSASVGGIVELEDADPAGVWPGTLQYTAPECLLGERGTIQSDLFSLGVITYQMLSGRLPYGDRASRIQSQRDIARLQFSPPEGVPPWTEAAIERAVTLDPRQRYGEVSEFLYDLAHPASQSGMPGKPASPPSQRLRFWQTTSLVLLCAVFVLLVLLVVR